MKLNKIKYLLTAFLFLVTSCKEVINVELNNTTPRLVIEGVVTDQPGHSYVKLSTSGDYYIDNSFGTVSNAIVVISDDKGTIDSLKETAPGIYQTSKLLGEVGATYTLTVNTNGEEYKSVTTMQSPTHIDSIAYVYNTAVGPGTGGGKDPGYDLHCYFRVKSGTRQYYFMKLYVNGEKNDSYFLFDSKLLNRQTVDFQRFGKRFNENDSLKVELIHVEQSVYSYFETLNGILKTGGMKTATPDNPNTNISNGALGYFAAYSVQADSVIVKVQ